MVRCLVPSVSNGDSIDWKEPSSQEIINRVVPSVSSGSILLFHNDLENTTVALSQILEQLSAEGYEFVSVSDLIYHENYSINAEGEQIPDVLSSLGIDTENVDEVMAEYSEEIAAAGFSEEQISEVAKAIKSGEGIPEEVLATITELGIQIPDAVEVNALAGDVENENADDKGNAQK